MNRRERRAMRRRNYHQAQYYATLHDYRLACHNLRQMLDAITAHRDPLWAQYRYDPEVA